MKLTNLLKLLTITITFTSNANAWGIKNLEQCMNNTITSDLAEINSVTNTLISELNKLEENYEIVDELKIFFNNVNETIKNINIAIANPSLKSRIALENETYKVAKWQDRFSAMLISINYQCTPSPIRIKDDFYCSYLLPTNLQQIGYKFTHFTKNIYFCLRKLKKIVS